ncbi:MAG: DNA-directed RNA polymerase sigma-70 factor [Phycisphaerae bacterium]|nr:MAG: DNA-directed RNA polymerase sigma-70 factor [Phycisphaerae bacterium]
MSQIDRKEVTQILIDLRHGSIDATERLLAVVYGELRRLAEAKMRSERADHTLQPTALVNEAFIRLLGEGCGDWENRRHFFGAAAEAMRRILVDYARKRLAQKRGADAQRVALDAGELMAGDLSDVVMVDDALGRLAEMDETKAEVVKLRFFAGLSIEATADVLEISVSTANRHWNFAKAWLFREIRNS